MILKMCSAHSGKVDQCEFLVFKPLLCGGKKGNLQTATEFAKKIFCVYLLQERY